MFFLFKDKTTTNTIEAQEKVLQRYVEAIQYGLAILDTHFERVEVKSDNNENGGLSSVEDDEDAGISVEPILEPKDPYIFRPLPHLIGTAEFMQDDNVGLGDLLTLRDDDGYEVQHIVQKDDSDSVKKFKLIRLKFTFYFLSHRRVLMIMMNQKQEN